MSNFCDCFKRKSFDRVLLYECIRYLQTFNRYASYVGVVIAAIVGVNGVVFAVFVVVIAVVDVIVVVAVVIVVVVVTAVDVNVNHLALYTVVRCCIAGRCKQLTHGVTYR